MAERHWSWAGGAQSTRDAVAALNRDGYAIVPNVLDAAELAELRDAIDRVAAREREDGTAWFSNGNQRIFNLLNRGDAFVDLIEHPAALTVVEAVLGDGVLLSSITANVAQPGNVPQLLHADQQYVVEPWPQAVVVNTVWMLDDFTPENGATRLVPGSHVHGRRPPEDDVPTMAMTATAGSLAVLEGRLWHGTGGNVTRDERRRAIFSDYCAPFIRPKENVFRSLREDVEAALTPRQRGLLGYDIWYGMGTVDGLPRHWMKTGQRSGPATPVQPAGDR